jgi:4-amino-4-deoxychorismate lyase
MILVNGKTTDSISVMDRGLTYGDGLFETIAVKQYQPLLWDLHWHRLQAGCESLNIACPDVTVIETEVERLLDHVRSNRQEHCVIKIIVTRGTGGRGYRTGTDMYTSRILMTSEWPEYPENYYTYGVNCQVCSTRLSMQPALAGIKHLNRLEQVLARMEWGDQAIAEGVMLDGSDNVIEGTMSNIFFVTDSGEIETPILEHCGVDGVQRKNIIHIASARQMTLKQINIGINSLDKYSEAFLTNSLIGIWPVRSLGQYTFEPGIITEELQQALGD